MDAQTASGKTTELPELKSPVVAAIEAAWATRNDEQRGYLGASVLGRECERALWYDFRWAHEPEKFDGRMLRLFATGDVEEERLKDDLRAIGVEVLDRDPATGEQWAISFASGHARGHADGRLKNVPGAEKTEHLFEAKTHNDKSFKALKKDGVEKAKPVHYAQMQIYMHGLGLTRALYLAKNKNDDELYAKRVKYDAAKALQLVSKAERIVAAHAAPAKLHDDPEAKMAWMCRSCPALGICHHGEFARRTCRTCLHATPVEGGKWTCARFDRDLTIEDQRAGCAHHLYLPSLVPGEQIDADEALEHVTYRLATGAEWKDGMAEATS